MSVEARNALLKTMMREREETMTREREDIARGHVELEEEVKGKQGRDKIASRES